MTPTFKESTSFNSLQQPLPKNRRYGHLRLYVRALICLWSIGLLGQPVTCLAQQPRFEPLPVKEALAARTFGPLPMAISPGDDPWAAYQLRDPQRKELAFDRYSTITRNAVPGSSVGGDIYITNIRSGETRSLTGEKGTSWSPAWSPDGNYLAFYSDRSGQPHLWLWDRRSAKLKQISEGVPRPYLYGFEVPVWTPDSSRVLIKVFPEGASIEKALARQAGLRTSARDDGIPQRVEVFESEVDSKIPQVMPQTSLGILSAADVPDFAADLAMVDVESGKLQYITHGLTPAGTWLSPDGSMVAFLNLTGSQNRRPLFDLVVLSLSNASPRVAATAIQQAPLGLSVSWSPDSKLIGYMSSGDCFIVPSDNSGASRSATKAVHPRFIDSGQPPIWDANGHSINCLTIDSVWRISIADGEAREIAKLPGKNIRRIIAKEDRYLWSPDGGNALLIATRDNESKQSGFYKVDFADGKVIRQIETDMEFAGSPDIQVTPSGQEVLFVSEDALHGKDIWKVPATFASPPRRVTEIAPIFAQYALGSSELIHWKSSDGTPLRGILLLPTGYQPGKRYPLIVDLYGGKMLSDNINVFGHMSTVSIVGNTQFFATRGYAILMPDTPLAVDTPMLDLAKTVLPGLDKVIEMGVADPERLGVTGASYGGYSTLALIVQTSRFKAAVSDAGSGNLLGIYSHMDEFGASLYLGWAETGQGRMGGSPWTYRNRYIENSPTFYLDRVKTPLLIIQGTNDRACPSFLGDELFISLRRLGKEAVYVKYQGESHTAATYSYDSQVDYLNRVIAFFDKKLKSGGSKSLAN